MSKEHAIGTGTDCACVPHPCTAGVSFTPECPQHCASVTKMLPWLQVPNIGPFQVRVAEMLTVFYNECYFCFIYWIYCHLRFCCNMKISGLPPRNSDF